MSLVPVWINNQLIGMAVHANQARHADMQARLLPNLPFTGLRHRLAGFHAAAWQTPLTVICAARKKDPPLLIEDGSRTPQSDFSLPANPFTIKNLCHFEFPLLEVE